MHAMYFMMRMTDLVVVLLLGELSYGMVARPLPVRFLTCCHLFIWLISIVWPGFLLGSVEYFYSLFNFAVIVLSGLVLPVAPLRLDLHFVFIYHPRLTEVVVLNLLDNAAPHLLLLLCSGHHSTGCQQAGFVAYPWFVHGTWLVCEYLWLVLLGYLLLGMFFKKSYIDCFWFMGLVEITGLFWYFSKI